MNGCIAHQVRKQSTANEAQGQRMNISWCDSNDVLKVTWLGRRCRGDRREGLLVAGRKVLADLALSQDDVRALALDRGVLGKSGADRRNLYLVRFGSCPFSRPPAPA